MTIRHQGQGTTQTTDAGGVADPALEEGTLDYYSAAMPGDADYPADAGERL